MISFISNIISTLIHVYLGCFYSQWMVRLIVDVFWVMLSENQS